MWAEWRTTTWHGAETGFAETLRPPAVGLQADLVPARGAATGAVHDRHVVEAEPEQHGLLRPLVDPPLADAFALGHAQAAVVEGFEGGVDSVTHVTLCIDADVVAVVEGGFDQGFKAGEVHCRLL